MATLFIPDASRLAAAGFTAIADVPVLFDCQHRYCRAFNRYLRERALGEWIPDVYGKRRVRYPRRRTILNIAYRLKNWIEWCRARDFDWRTVSYREHLLAYRDEMLNGTWSADHTPLSVQTSEHRVDAAVQFLSWASQRGLRPDFIVPTGETETYAGSGSSSRRFKVRRAFRAGRRRPNPASLQLPGPAGLKTWLATVRARCGHAKWLAARFILEVGVRLEEAVQFKERHLPPRDEWNVVGGQVTVLLVDGTKGGKTRHIRLPLKLALALDEYRKGRRLTAIAKLRRLDRRAPLPENLFLFDETGLPLTRSALYRAWKHGAPYRSWSPHLGRHAWACLTLLDFMKNELEKGKNLSGLPEAVFWEMGRLAVATVIQPQLGHVDKATTDLYLRWMWHMIGAADHYRSWHDFLNDGEE